MQCNNFCPTIYTNPIYSFMKHKPILVGIQLPVGFGCHHSAPLSISHLPLVQYYINQETAYYLLIPQDYTFSHYIENLFKSMILAVLVCCIVPILMFFACAHPMP